MHIIQYSSTVHREDPVSSLVLALRLSALLEVLHNTCNTGTHDLPDMYAQSLRAAGKRIRQITRVHFTTIN